jgi:hypothetical protein
MGRGFAADRPDGFTSSVPKRQGRLGRQGLPANGGQTFQRRSGPLGVGRLPTGALAPAALLAGWLFFAAWLAPSAAKGAPFDLRGEDWEGLSQLVKMAQGELGPDRVAVTSSLALKDLKREDALFLVHPERTLDVDELAAFLRAGGRVVLLDDYGTGDELLARFGIRRVPLPARPAEVLRGNPSFAIAEPASGHAAVRDVAHVVTNHATGLEHPGLSKLLVVRSVETNGAEEPGVILALAGAVGQGRLIAVGDASIGINAMLRFPGNRALCLSLLRYATEDDSWGSRNGKLFLLANDFQTTGNYGKSSAGAFGEGRRALAEALETLRHDGMPPLAAYLVALALGLGVIGWMSTRAGRTHKPVLPKYVRPVAVAQQGGVAGRAAVVGAPATSRILAMLELKSALEEQVATRLGLDRVPSHDELVEKVRSAGLLDDEGLNALASILGRLANVETMLVMHRRGVMDRVRDKDVVTMAARVDELLGAIDAAGKAIAGAREPRPGDPDGADASQRDRGKVARAP